MDSCIEVPEWAVISAVRYALGRSSYAVGDTADLVRSLWPKLSDHARKIIRHELEGHIRFSERLNKIAFNPEDLTTWKNLLGYLTPLARLSPTPQVVNPGVKLTITKLG